MTQEQLIEKVHEVLPWVEDWTIGCGLNNYGSHYSCGAMRAQGCKYADKCQRARYTANKICEKEGIAIEPASC